MSIILLLLGIVQLILGICCLYYEYWSGSLSVFFWGTLIIMFHVPHIITCITQSTDYPIWVYCSASVFVVAFDIIYLITRMFLTAFWKKNDVLKNVKNMNCNDMYSVERKWRAYYVICIIGTTLIMIIYIRSISGNILSSSWGGILNNQSSNIVINLLFYLIPFFVDASGGLLIYFLVHKKYRYLLIFSIVLAFSIIIRREKQRLLVLAIPFLFVIYAKNRNITLKSIIKYMIYIVVGYSGVLILAFMRDGTLGDFLNNFDIDILIKYAFDNIFDSSGELALRQQFYFFIEKHNKFEGFNYGADYIRMILFWLPTKYSFGIKPKDFAVTMGGAILGVPSQTIYSTHPTIYGECFASFNYFGIFLALFWAVFFSWMDSRAVVSNAYMKKVGLCNVVGVCYVMIARGAAYNGFFTIIISFFILETISFFFTKIKVKIL